MFPHQTRLGHKPKTFRGDTRGSVATEFATTGAALILMLLTLLEGAGMMMAQGVMDNAVNRAARYGMTGAGGDFAARESQIVEIIRSSTFGLLDPDKIAIDTQAYDSFSSVGDSEVVFDSNGNGTLDSGESFDDKNGDGIQQISTGTSSPGGAGEVVVYQVVYKWKGLTPLMTKTVGEVTLRANLPVKNEVF
ncbi:MAG: pilus assembly protein [Alphaproteobacteria bacterium]|nr:pilus assembly protein [Alphaproteobacteria bacterium]